jgi:hypothetical protein
MKEIKVKLWKKSNFLSEIGQVTGIHYAFLSSEEDGYKQCHPWVKCRDFLHDVLRGNISGKNENIYGFSYVSGTNPPLDTKNMRMMVKRNVASITEKTLKETEKIMDSSVSILRCVEEYSGIHPHTEVHKVAENKEFFIFEGSPEWVSSTFMVSLYTFLIRLGAKKISFKNKKELHAALKDLYKKKASSDHDITYLRTVHPFMDKIIEKRKDLAYIRKGNKPIFEESGINVFHNYTGIVSLSKEAAKEKPGSNDAKLKELHELSRLIVE